MQLRSEALNAYIIALLSQDAALSNIHVLSFLGLMNLNRFEEESTSSSPTTSKVDKDSSHGRGSSESGSSNHRLVGSDDEGGGEDSIIISTERDSFLKVNPSNRSEIMSPVLGSSKKRPVMHISTLRAHAAPGDLVLFRCANSMSGIQV